MNETSSFFSTLTWPVVILALTFPIDSVVWKRKLIANAVKKHDPSDVNRAYILALALCEATALFGLLLKFQTGFRYYYLLFAVAACGVLLHFPRKTLVLEAYEAT